MTATLARKVAFRAEHTGSISQDRAQRMAQQVGQAHEVTKNVVAALANQSYVALAADSPINATTYATLLTATITTVLDSGHLVLTFTASGVEVSLAGTIYFELLVNGTVVKGAYSTVAAGAAFAVSIMARVSVTRATHTVLVKWKTSVNGARINAATVVEEHAHLLVQESL